MESFLKVFGNGICIIKYVIKGNTASIGISVISDTHIAVIPVNYGKIILQLHIFISVRKYIIICSGAAGNEQKNRIVSLRQAGYGYTAVARELGMTKSAVCKYCHQIGLAGVGNNLINKEDRGNVGGEQRPETKVYKATYHFADEPNEGVVDEVLRILMNVR